jgi:hypothetical protein
MYQGYTEPAEVIEAKRRAIAAGKQLPSQRREPKQQPVKIDPLLWALATKRQQQEG